jgi:hypothetical protein
MEGFSFIDSEKAIQHAIAFYTTSTGKAQPQLSGRIRLFLLQPGAKGLAHTTNGKIDGLCFYSTSYSITAGKVLVVHNICHMPFASRMQIRRILAKKLVIIAKSEKCEEIRWDFDYSTLTSPKNLLIRALTKSTMHHEYVQKTSP